MSYLFFFKKDLMPSVLMDRVSSSNTFGLKHRILGNDGFIVLVDLGSEGIRTTSNDGEGNKTSAHGNSNGSTSRDTSNEAKVKWANVVFVARASTSIFGPVDITSSFGTIG